MAQYRFRPFIKAYESRGITAGSLRWQIANAERNGLSAAGAINKFYPQGEGRGKPIIVIDDERYFMVLGGQGSR